MKIGIFEKLPIFFMNNTFEETPKVTTSPMASTIEDQKVNTNIRELIKIVAVTIAGVSAWYSIKTDIRDYAAKQELNQKVTEIRISTIELRLTQIENDQKEQKKQRDEEIQKQLDRKNESVHQ